MSQTITIQVKNKIAETDFDEVVSFNDGYRLRFSFDEEWDAFPNRVAVVMWQGGTSEWLFEGAECDMPAVDTLYSEYALVGVYSVNGGKRIASSFVRLRCRAGALGAPLPRPVDSLHEQILERLNEGMGASKESLTIGDKTYNGSKPVTVTADDLGLAKVAKSGSYNDLTGKPSLSRVATSGNYEDLTGKPSLSRVATSGSYDDLTGKPTVVSSVNGKTGAVTVSSEDLGLAAVAKSGSYNDLTDKPDLSGGGGGGGGAVSSVNGKTGAVTVTAEDLNLGALAKKDQVEEGDLAKSCITNEALATGCITNSKIASYTIAAGKIENGAVVPLKVSDGLIVAGNNISVTRTAKTGVYTIGTTFEEAVTSVNGQTGAVTVSKHDLGLGKLTEHRQMPLGDEALVGGDFNELKTAGFYQLNGTSGTSVRNMPLSTDNSDLDNCSWYVLVLNQQDNSAVTQVAFSGRSDCAIRIRCFTGGSWSMWKNVVN